MDQQDNDPQYEASEDINEKGIVESLTRLHLIESDMYLQSQAYNLGIVDKFIMDMEYKVLREWFKTDRTPSLTFFLSAQSQMWIFAVYEFLRTWRQRAKDIVKLADNGGLEQKLTAMKEKEYSYVHFGHNIRISQIENVIKEPTLISQLKKELLHLYIPFRQLEHIRISLAKHELSRKSNSAALMPGYGRINIWCGSLDYDLENGIYSMGFINRRNIADSIRHLDFSQDPPSEEELSQFDDYMNGKNLPPIDMK